MANGFIASQGDRTVIGAVSEGSPADRVIGGIFTSPAGGASAFVVNELGVYCDNSGGGAGTATFRMAIYSLTGGGDLDAPVDYTTSDKDAPSSAGWVEWTGLSITIDGSTDYGIVIWCDDANFDFEGCLSPGASNGQFSGIEAGQWTWPTISGSVSYRTREYSIYAVYEAAAGGGLSIPVAMHHYTKNIGNNN